MENPETPFCLICGYHLGTDLPEGQRHITCPCCSSQVGYTYQPNEDRIDHVKHVRNTWIDNGYAWNKPELMPPKWSLVAQLRNIPAKYR